MEMHSRQTTCKRNSSVNEVVPRCHIRESGERRSTCPYAVCMYKGLFFGTSQARFNLITFQLQLVREGRNQCSLRSSFVLPSFQIWSQASSWVLNSLRLVRSFLNELVFNYVDVDKDYPLFCIQHSGCYCVCMYVIYMVMYVYMYVCMYVLMEKLTVS